MRGTGKTSIAKIFARAINCENPQNGDVCGQCAFCGLSAEDLTTVIFEADAASNNGVENIRDLREEVSYLAPFGRYKVYIIDEVHMLSTSAFNALLKTLEEPPPHVVFILATTEPQKIPATIHSRCQRFDFKRISVPETAEAISGYMKAESVNVDFDALTYIARASDGSMRDALSILDQCLSYYYGEDITLDKVVETLGAVDRGILFEFSDALCARDAEKCMALIDGAVINGRDLAFLTEELIHHLRDIVIAGSIRDMRTTALDLPDHDLDKIRDQVGRFDISSLITYISKFSELHTRMKTASNHRILLEVACIELCGAAEVKAEPAVKTPKPKIIAAPMDDIASVWPKVIDNLGHAKAFFAKTFLEYADGVLTVMCGDANILDFIKDKKDLLIEVLSKEGKTGFDIRFDLAKSPKKKPPSDVSDDYASILDWINEK